MIALLRTLPTLSRYNRWMNQRLYAVIADLSEEARRQDRGAFFRSIHGTLNHLLLVDRLWLARFNGTPDGIAGLDQELFADYSALWAARRETDDDIDGWVWGLTEAALEAPLPFHSVSAGRTVRLPLWQCALHLFNHQTHHRGQLTTLLSQAGVEPGLTDLIWLPGCEL